ncbi:MAG: hypothetical protein AAFP17_16100 [Pseudomonadota bacterium]
MTFPFETGFSPNASADRRGASALALRAELERLQTETVTGRAADAPVALDGRTAEAQRLEGALSALEGYGEAAALVAARAETQQAALGGIRDVVEELVSALQSAASAGSGTGLAVAAPAAENALDVLVTALNTRFAGRALFSGDAGDRSALVQPETIAAAAATAAGAAPDAEAADAAVRALFDTPGGDFDTVFYTGGTGNGPATAIAEGETVRLTLRADDPVFRNLLRETTAALSAATGSGTFEERRALVEESALGLRTALEGLARNAGALGVTEQRIETARAANATEQTQLNRALGALTGRDQFEAASTLTATEDALEALFVTTARISALTLTNFIR